MTEQERYLFDLQGFLVVPNALSRATIDQLNFTMDTYTPIPTWTMSLIPHFILDEIHFD